VADVFAFVVLHLSDVIKVMLGIVLKRLLGNYFQQFIHYDEFKMMYERTKTLLKAKEKLHISKIIPGKSPR
jgi:hypothetical protein